MIRQLADKKTFRQFVTFCFIGVINTAVGLSIILGLMHLAHVNYILANMAGYAVGLCVSFLLNRTITFRETSTNRKVHGQAFWFLLVFAASYLTQLCALMIMVRILGWNETLSQILASGIYTVLGFLGNRLKTFV